MEMSMAFHGKRVLLSRNDLFAKLTKLTKRKPDKEGFVLADMMYVIDHIGVRAAPDRKKAA